MPKRKMLAPGVKVVAVLGMMLVQVVRVAVICLAETMASNGDKVHMVWVAMPPMRRG